MDCRADRLTEEEQEIVDDPGPAGKEFSSPDAPDDPQQKTADGQLVEPGHGWGV